MRRKKAITKKVKKKVYKKQSALTKAALRKAELKNKRIAKMKAKKRSELVLANLIHNPRMAFRKDGTQMPSDTKVHKKSSTDGRVYRDGEDL